MLESEQWRAAISALYTIGHKNDALTAELRQMMEQAQRRENTAAQIGRIADENAGMERTRRGVAIMVHLLEQGWTAPRELGFF